MPLPPFSAVLLAAGRSVRMGRDKALLEADNAPLWNRQRDVLAAAGAAEILLSARPDQAWVPRVAGFSAVVYDAMPGCGPLVGVTAALERAAHPWLAVLAIDLPALSAGWFAELAAHCAPGVGVVGRREGWFEPLAALYPREFRFLAWEAMVRQEFSLQRLLHQAVAGGLMRIREIAPEEAPLFANWNEPARPSPSLPPSPGQA